MNPEILKQLKEVHLPPAPSWWPLAAGFYVIIFVVLASFVLACYVYKKKKPARALKKQLHLELQALEKSFSETGDTKALQRNIAQLLRRLVTKTKPEPTKNLELIELCPHLEKLWGASQTRELIELVEQNRFKAIDTLEGSQLLALANKKFKQCKF